MFEKMPRPIPPRFMAQQAVINSLSAQVICECLRWRNDYRTRAKWARDEAAQIAFDHRNTGGENA